MDYRDSYLHGVIFVLVATLLFSSMEIAFKILGSTFHPLQINALRFFAGGLVLLPFGLRSCAHHNVHLSTTHLKQWLGIGFLNIVGTMTFYQLSFNYAQASDVAIIFSVNPIFVSVFAVLILKAHLSRTDIWSLVVALSGILVIVNPITSHMNVLGVFFILTSALLFALCAVLSKRMITEIGAIMTTAGSFLFGALELIVLLLIGRTTMGADLMSSVGLSIFAHVPFFTGLTWDNAPLVAFISVGVTGIGFLAYFKSMEAVSASFGSITFFLKPALAPVLAALILHEVIAPLTVCGIVLLLVGSCITLVPQMMASLHLKKRRAIKHS